MRKELGIGVLLVVLCIAVASLNPKFLSPVNLHRPLPLGQEIINTHIKCRDEGVEVGVHEASMVNVANSNASFGALVMSPCTHTGRSNTESTI